MNQSRKARWLARLKETANNIAIWAFAWIVTAIYMFESAKATQNEERMIFAVKFMILPFVAVMIIVLVFLALSMIVWRFYRGLIWLKNRLYKAH